MNDKYSEIERELEAMYQYRGIDQVVPSDVLKEKLASTEGSDWELSLAIPTLDRMIEGIDPGSLVVISAPTGEGKTKMAETLTINLIKSGNNSLWFSFEMPARYLFKRFNVPFPVFYLPEEIIDDSLEWVRKKIVEGIAKFATKAVFIDHLHFLYKPKMGSGNISIEIGGIMRQLKLLALRYEIVIFLICHTRKIGFQDKLSLESIRDSSFIAQEADLVLMLSREKIEDSNGQIVPGRQTRVSIQKNRKTGQTGSVTMQLINGKFEEIIKGGGDKNGSSN